MNREIKFRWKRIDNWERVYGCLTRYSEEISYITVDLIKNEVYKVYTKTVGQYTCLKDKKLSPIYEGDIVKYDNLWSERDECGKVWEIKWKDDSFFIWIYDSLIQAVGNRCIEIIWNIYKNSELLLPNQPQWTN